MMQTPTHLLTGWCLGNTIPSLTPRERFLAMTAAAFPDIDSLTLLFGLEAYGRYHHTFGHNLWTALIMTAGFSLLSQRRVRAALLYFALFHLHLLQDYFGSGRGWGFPYLWPLDALYIDNIHSWDLYSWQNTTVMLLLLSWTVWIAIRKGRTPFEYPLPNIDRSLRFKRSTASTGGARSE